ncbi:MAG: aldehyde dehydrogenase (NADP(+)) [Acidimicrobiales bacterium]
MKVVSTNPATGETRDLDVDEASPAEVRRLSELALDAAPDLAARSLEWRAGMLRAMADELEVDRDALVTVADEETALGRPRLEGELRRTAFQLRFFAGVVEDGSFLDASIDHATDSPMGPLPDLRRVMVPLGPVAVFGSSNFPFAFSVPGGDTASALAAGCPVVIKAHPAHPATSLACFAALERAARAVDAPTGTLGLVFGVDAGTALVDSPAISAVGFTGSVAGGRALWQRAHSRPHPIPFFGELGAANPLVVTPTAAAQRGEEIGEGVAGSLTLGAGQFCTKPGLVFVPEGPDGDGLMTALAGALVGRARFTLLSAAIAERFREGARAIHDAGARALVGPSDAHGAQADAALFEVSVDEFVAPGATTLREECFGPVGVVVRYASPDDLRRALEAAAPSLAFSLFAADDDPDSAWLLGWAATRAGRVVMNAYPTGVGVSWSMQHGGPWPSTTQASSTSVGAAAIHRWLRPVTYQGVANALLPLALRDATTSLPRRVDGVALPATTV